MAPSQESQVLTDLFKEFAANFPQGDNLVAERYLYDQVYRAAAECPGVAYEDTTVAGRPCLWVLPAAASKTHCMLFMHGGGFTMGSPMGHRRLTAHLAKACNVPALSVDYRLTPEHPYPAPLDDCVAAYSWLINERGFKPEHVVLAGDSCGGGLVTSVPLAAARKGLPMPAASISLSPWYDLTGSGETRTTNEEHDVLNTKPFHETITNRYLAGGTSKKDPLVSPLFASEADLKQLPPHWISIGGHDMLRDDGERMAKLIQAAGVEVVSVVHESQQHVMEFMAGRAPEADESIKQIGKWVRKKIGC